MTPPGEEAFLELIGRISRHTGLSLDGYKDKCLRRRIAVRMRACGVQSYQEYQELLERDAAEVARLKDTITINVTSFYRNAETWNLVRNRVLPELLSGGWSAVRAWSAGCSSGEEAYASAILLEEAGLYDRAQIYATDLNPAVLEQARQGVYSAERFAVFAENYARYGGGSALSVYGTMAYDQVALRDALKRNILFFQHDLVSDHVFGEMNVIFCRNVFIYFTPQLRERVLRKFAQSLCPGGFLCLGGGERLPAASGLPFSEFAREERIYRYEG